MSLCVIENGIRKMTFKIPADSANTEKPAHETRTVLEGVHLEPYKPV